MTQNEWLHWFLQGRAPERLAEAAGLNAAEARAALTYALPKQLAELQSYAATPAGERELLRAASTIPTFASVEAALDAPGGAGELKAGGQVLAPSALSGRHDELVRDAAQHTGAGALPLSNLLYMTLPLLISHFAQRQGAGAVLLPPLATAASVSAVPGVVMTEGAPVSSTPAPASPPAPLVTQTTTAVERQRSFPWWLALLPLLLLGGCWLSNQNKPQPAPQAQSEAQSVAQSQAQVTPTPADFAITSPEDGAEVPASGFSMQGTGPAGTAYSIYRDDAEVGNFTVGTEGSWNVDVVNAAAPAGQATYTVRDRAGQEVGTLPVTIVAGEDGAATPADLTITAPADGAEVTAGGFDMSGTGTPGTVFQLYEDGVNVGTFTVGDDGNWTVDVAGPGAGAHTYDVLNAEGVRVATLPLTVVAPAEAQTCTDDLSISLADGENVTAPFRFGGRGSGEAVLVTVWRGDRQIGEQRVAISPSCTWSYLSRPGGREGVDKNVPTRCGLKAAAP